MESLLAVDNPSAYVKTFPGRMKARGLDPDRNDHHVFAFIDSATAVGWVCELDTRASLEEISRALVTLGRRLHVDWVSIAKSLEDLPTGALLRRAAARIKDGPFRLCWFDIKSDCLPVLLVRAERVAAALSCARKARVPLKAL